MTDAEVFWIALALESAHMNVSWIGDVRILWAADQVVWVGETRIAHDADGRIAWVGTSPIIWNNACPAWIGQIPVT